jgi:hypothetical protein
MRTDYSHVQLTERDRRLILDSVAHYLTHTRTQRDRAWNWQVPKYNQWVAELVDLQAKLKLMCDKVKTY